VFNASFSNISAISWQPVLVVEEAGVPGENHRPWASKKKLNWSDEDILMTSLGSVFYNLAASYLKDILPYFVVLSGNISCIYT
jgi:hypothetical protein